MSDLQLWTGLVFSVMPGDGSLSQGDVGFTKTRSQEGLQWGHRSGANMPLLEWLEKQCLCQGNYDKRLASLWPLNLTVTHVIGLENKLVNQLEQKKNKCYCFRSHCILYIYIFLIQWDCPAPAPIVFTWVCLYSMWVTQTFPPFFRDLQHYRRFI